MAIMASAKETCQVTEILLSMIDWSLVGDVSIHIFQYFMLELLCADAGTVTRAP